MLKCLSLSFVLSLLLLISFSVVSYSYVLGPVPQEPRVEHYGTNVKPPLTHEGCDDCIKNYYSVGVQEDLLKYHLKKIWNNKNTAGSNDSVE